MAEITWPKLNRVMSLLGGVAICVLCFTGCSTSYSSGSNVDSVLNNSELDFQRQADLPPTAKTLYAMADILAKQGRDSESEFILKRTIQNYPEFRPACNSLAELQMRQGRTDAAIETIQDALRIHSADPVLLNNLGMCWIVRRDYESALEMFTKAADIMSENARYRANMAVALGLMGRYEESLSLFKQVLPAEQANHNLKVLREAGNSVKPALTMPSESPDSQLATK